MENIYIKSMRIVRVYTKKGCIMSLKDFVFLYDLEVYTKIKIIGVL